MSRPTGKMKDTESSVCTYRCSICGRRQKNSKVGRAVVFKHLVYIGKSSFDSRLNLKKVRTWISRLYIEQNQTDTQDTFKHIIGTTRKYSDQPSAE